MTHVTCESGLGSVLRSSMHPCIYVQETGWQLAVQLCIMPRLPRHLVEELQTLWVLTLSFLILPKMSDLCVKIPLLKKHILGN